MKKCWNDLTVGDLMKIRSIDSLQLATEDEKNLHVASIVGEIDYNKLLDMPLNEVRGYMDACEFLFQPPKARKVKRKYEVNGRKYRLLKNEMEMLTSQYIDFQAIYKDGFDKRPGELLSIMLVPEGHTYNDGYDKEEVINDMYDMHVEDALGIVDFFTQRFVRSIAWTRMYYRIRMKLMRLFARKEDKEMYRVMEIQLNLIMDELECLYGWLVPKR